MPGLDDKDFEVTVSGDLLTLKGEKKAEHEQRDGDASTSSAASVPSRARFACPSMCRTRRWTRAMKRACSPLRVPKPADMQRQARRIDVRTV